MSAYTPRPEDFAPLGEQDAAPVLVRPSLSYWADARARLLRNPRAVGSLALLALLGLFTTVGPLFWTVELLRCSQQRRTPTRTPPASAFRPLAPS